MEATSIADFQAVVLSAAERLQAKLVRYSSRFFGGDTAPALDVVQHAFLQLCRLREAARPDNLDAWLYRVCRNRAIDLCRRDKREQTVQTGELMDQMIDNQVEAGDQLSEHELYELVYRRMRRLPVSQREAVLLWSDGFCYREISSIMERPETTVRVLVHRGLTSLRNDKQIMAATGDPCPQRIGLQI